MKTVFLAFNQIESISIDCKTFSSFNVEKLELTGNRLSELPPEIGN